MFTQFQIWEFLAGLGIFLLAMVLLETALEFLAGRSFKKFLQRHTHHPIKAILSGIGITAILQSSSVVSLMVLAFVGAGIIELKNAIGIIIGSNLGTTLTGWVVAYFGFSFNIESFALPFLAFGGLSMVFFPNKDLFYLPYQFFAKQERLNIYGELGYYLFSYKYFGIGNNTKEEEEIYDVNYPRFRINVLKKVRPNFYLGIRYWLDDYNIIETEPEGALSNGKIAGSASSFLSGVGLVLNYDSRNNLFFPDKGYYIETVLFVNGNYLGSDFDFTKFYLDARTYIAFKKSVVAFNFLGEFTGGTPPFNQLSYIGGSYKMRGIFEGRYKDNHSMVFQGEYRYPLFWRLKAALFASYGMVAENFDDFKPNNFRLSYGIGLRLLVNKKEKIHLRFDAGFGKGTKGYYVTIGEAF